MDSKFIFTLGFCIGFLALLVESQQNVDVQFPPPPPPPPSPSPSPPPPFDLPPPPPPDKSPPPPPSPYSPPPPPPPVSPPPPSPPPLSPPPPSTVHQYSSNLHPPLPHRKRLPRAPPKSGKLRSPPPSRKHKGINFGKKIGLFFTGIVAILQVCVAAFLFIKRRQLLKAGFAL